MYYIYLKKILIYVYLLKFYSIDCVLNNFVFIILFYDFGYIVKILIKYRINF